MTKTAKRKTAKKTDTRATQAAPSRSTTYAPARRLEALRILLQTSGAGVTYEAMEQHLEASRSTVQRLLRALSSTDAVEEDVLDGRKVYRIRVRAGTPTLRTNITQIVALHIARSSLASLAGTGLENDISEVYDMLANTLRHSDAALARHLDRKLYDVGDAPFDLTGREDDVNDILTALLHEHKLEIDYVSGTAERRTIVVRPYSLFFFRKGLYLATRSEFHGTLRTFALDVIEGARWLKGQRFEYPAEYHPKQLIGDAFGIMRGERTRVRIRFDAAVVRYVRRRRWHASQQFTPCDDGRVELSLEVEGTTEVRNWVLSFGAHAEVLEPETLRREMAQTLAAAAARYTRA